MVEDNAKEIEFQEKLKNQNPNMFEQDEHKRQELINQRKVKQPRGNESLRSGRMENFSQQLEVSNRAYMNSSVVDKPNTTLHQDIRNNLDKASDRC